MTVYSSVFPTLHSNPKPCFWLGLRSVPCPRVDLIGGFNQFFKTALRYNGTQDFDPYANDINFLISMWLLEEIGATGDKVMTFY